MLTWTLVSPIKPVGSVLRYLTRRGDAGLATADLDARDPEFVRREMDMAR